MPPQNNQQLPLGFIPDELPQGFIPDDEDDIPLSANSRIAEPQLKFENVTLPDGNVVSRRVGETESQAKSRINTRPDTAMFGVDPGFWGRMSNSLSDKFGTSEAVPDWLRKPATEFADLWGVQVPKIITEMFAEPESVVTPGVLKSLTRKPKIPIPEVLPPIAPPAPKQLTSGPSIIAGPGGAERVENLIDRPKDIEMLRGDPVPQFGGSPRETTTPSGTVLDTDELRESRRLKDLFYTQYEQPGLRENLGTRMEIPDEPLTDIPPQSGDMTLGFEPISRAGTDLVPFSPNALDMPYPYNVVPERLRPRTAQTVTQALVPERFATDPWPIEPEGLEIGTLRDPNVPQHETSFTLDQPDFRGGTAAIEPGEPILPSAPKKLRISPHIQEAEREVPIGSTNRDPIIDSVIGAPRKPPTTFGTRVANNVANNAQNVIPDASAQVAPIIAQNERNLKNVADGLFVSGEKQFERMGPVGNHIRRVLSSVEYEKRELFNKFADPYINATKKLTPEEADNFVDAMEGVEEPLSPNVAAAVTEARKVTDLMAQMAIDAGVRMKNPQGKVMAFKPIKEYWPHRPVNPINHTMFIEELMNSNPGLSRSQAEKLAKEFQSESEWFNSPQHARMLGDFEYRKDLNAMIDHMVDMADIIARAKHLGPGDISDENSIISKLIEQTPNSSLASELTRTHLRGGMDRNNNFYRGLKRVNNLVTKSQVFTKLGMFPISNLNNQMQTMLHGNLTDFTSSLVKTITGSPTLKSLAKEYGTVSVGELPVEMLSEFNRKQVPIVGSMIQWSENFARTIATGTGVGTSKSLFKSAQAGDKLAVKKLQNLLLHDDITEILKQSELNPNQLKFATQRFVELSQQLGSNMKIPPVWANEPLLQIPLIFKKMSFQGTKSVKDAIMMDPTRNIPLFLVAAPLLGELTGDLKSIVYGAIRGGPIPEDMFDAIKFELEGRHKFAGKFTGLDSDEGSVEWLANRLAANYIQSWGLGLVGDIMQGALGGENAGYTALVGPAIEQAFKVGSNATSMTRDILTGDFEGAIPEAKELGREGLRSIPLLGPGMQKRLLPYESQEIR